MGNIRLYVAIDDVKWLINSNNLQQLVTTLPDPIEFYFKPFDAAKKGKLVLAIDLPISSDILKKNIQTKDNAATFPSFSIPKSALDLNQLTIVSAYDGPNNNIYQNDFFQKLDLITSYLDACHKADDPRYDSKEKAEALNEKKRYLKAIYEEISLEKLPVLFKAAAQQATLLADYNKNGVQTQNIYELNNRISLIFNPQRYTPEKLKLQFSQLFQELYQEQRHNRNWRLFWVVLLAFILTPLSLAVSLRLYYSAKANDPIQKRHFTENEKNLYLTSLKTKEDTDYPLINSRTAKQTKEKGYHSFLMPKAKADNYDQLREKAKDKASTSPTNLSL